MTNDIVALIDYYEREKTIERSRVVSALEFAFVAAYRKMIPGADAIQELRGEVDTKKGTVKVFASFEVVADGDQEDQFNEAPLSLARKREAEAQIGDRVEFDVTPKNFGRIAVQTAKQTIVQRLRQAEKEMIYEEFKDRAGEIVSGSVRRFEKSDVLIDLGKFEGRMPAKERVVTEDYNVGDRLRVYVVSVDNELRGPEIILSRSHPNFIRRLFEAEVNEISDRTVDIRALAREAGYRTKVAVFSFDEKVDPVGACVGLRGARVKNIVRELNNETVDIVRWSDDLLEFVADSLKPAVIRSSRIDQESKVITVTVDEDGLSKAIGRRGQNARLTSRLVGWDVQIFKDESQREQFEAKVADASHSLADILGLDEESADKLFRAGGATLSLVEQMPADYIAEALGMDLDQANDVLSKAKAKSEADAALLQDDAKAEEQKDSETPDKESSVPKADEVPS